MSKWSLTRSEFFSAKNSSNHFCSSTSAPEGKTSHTTHSLPSSPLCSQLRPKQSHSQSPKAIKKVNNNLTQCSHRSKCYQVRAPCSKPNAEIFIHNITQVTGVEIAAAAAHATITQATQTATVIAVTSADNSDNAVTVSRKFLKNAHDQNSHTASGSSRARLHSSTSSTVSQKIVEEDEETKSEFDVSSKDQSITAANYLQYRRRRFSSQPKIFQQCIKGEQYFQERR